jgi:hypothetical protein
MKNLALVLCFAACGSDPMPTCSAATCDNGKVYQQCITPGSTQVRYLLGGANCSCDAAQCADCTRLVAAYCANDNVSNSSNGSSGNGGTTTSGPTGNGSTTGNGGTTSSGPTGNGSTTTGSGGACKPGGSACQSFDECCSGTCANQVCTQCRDNGSPCTLASQCCSNICHVGSCSACGATGASCSDSHECCSGIACINGVCGGPDHDCTSQNRDSCGNCCINKYPSGSDIYANLSGTCICQSCVSSCGMLVCPSPAPMGDPTACTNCFVSQCEAANDAACLSNPTCAPYVQCANACLPM